MGTTPLPPDESARLQAPRECKILDAAPKEALDELTRLVSQICGTPVPLVSLIDPRRQWFKAKGGVTACDTSHDIPLCAHAILQRTILDVSNTLVDLRFATDPVETLGVIDRMPGQLTNEQRQARTDPGSRP